MKPRDVVAAVLCILALLMGCHNLMAHEAELDDDGGHFYGATGKYHFHTDAGWYEPSPKEAPANSLVGPWVFTAVPSETESWNRESVLEDTLALYTEGALTETALTVNGINPSVHKGHGWRLDWEIGFISENYGWCDENLLRIVGHLALARASNFFYAVMEFDATESARATIHMDYVATARAWLNGVEFRSSYTDGRQTEADADDRWPPEHPQAMIREGTNLLVVKVGRGPDCSWTNWFVSVGLKPHTPTRITVPFVYEDGGITVDYFTDSTDIHDINGDGVVNILDIVMIANAIKAAAAPSIARRKPKLTKWAALKRR